MYLLFSGEGATDLGTGTDHQTVCERESFLSGPMALMVDQLIESWLGYSVIESGACGFASKQLLVQRAGTLKSARKSIRLPGAKRAKETRYFFNNARALSRIARDKQAEYGSDVVAILFRDADGTASSERGEWADKHASMLHGFEEEGFERGVPMLPKPKSEAWLLCALKGKPYQDCGRLEARSGNDDSPNSLKAELQERLGNKHSRELLCALVRDRQVNAAGQCRQN